MYGEKRKGKGNEIKRDSVRGGGAEGRWRRKVPHCARRNCLYRRFSERLEFGGGRHTPLREFGGLGSSQTLTHSLALSLSCPKIISVHPFFLLLLCSSSNSSGESMRFPHLFIGGWEIVEGDADS